MTYPLIYSPYSIRKCLDKQGQQGSVKVNIDNDIFYRQICLNLPEVHAGILVLIDQGPGYI